MGEGLNRACFCFVLSIGFQAMILLHQLHLYHMHINDLKKRFSNDGNSYHECKLI